MSITVRFIETYQYPSKLFKQNTFSLPNYENKERYKFSKNNLLVRDCSYPCVFVFVINYSLLFMI